jgi:predicted acylesterase/phospholipase RssA
MSKVSIDNLENIVLEGGGAKGAAYAGAIKGIERALADCKGVPLTKDGKPDLKAILDYGEEQNGEFVPQVKRFAGSSAGAITSFALALGLNSKQIEDATKYPFKNFLQSTDVGKYRMIDKDGTISIGEDKRSFMGEGDGSKPYAFDLAEKQKIRASFFKAQLRGFILGIVKNVLIAGILQQLANIKAFYEKIASLFDGQSEASNSEIEPDKWGVWSFAFKYFFNILAMAGILKNTPTISNSPTQLAPSGPPATNSPQFNMIGTKIANELIDVLFWRLTKKNDMNLGMEALGNVFWDRGMFSGFAVREFFFDLMIFASVNDTHFQRSYFPNEDDREALNKVKMTMLEGRLKADFSRLNPGLQQMLRGLPNITFKEFYDCTKISLTLCVSNFTTDEPVYFSEVTSPDFPVMEAVGASMSIPPAIKPVYNAANAINQPSTADDLYNLNPETLGKKRGVDSQYFDMLQYEIDFAAIKVHLAEHFQFAIDGNNPMSFSGIQLLLLRFLREIDGQTGYRAQVLVDGSPVYLTYDHFVFHYNVAFKGLLMDGGYRCNIPYNIYRSSIFADDPTQTLLDPMFGHTLAVKLDNTFPKEWVARVFKLMREQEATMSAQRYFKKVKRGLFGGILKQKLPFLRRTVDGDQVFDLFEEDDIKSLNMASYDHIAEAVIDIHKSMVERYKTPWNKKKSITALAMEGYAYGSEEGQIRYLSDHLQIIPVYSYGIGTYDFNLDAIMPLVDLAKRKAEQKVVNYFDLPLQ